MLRLLASGESESYSLGYFLFSAVASPASRLGPMQSRAVPSFSDLRADRCVLYHAALDCALRSLFVIRPYVFSRHVFSRAAFADTAVWSTEKASRPPTVSPRVSYRTLPRRDLCVYRTYLFCFGSVSRIHSFSFGSSFRSSIDPCGVRALSLSSVSLSLSLSLSRPISNQTTCSSCRTQNQCELKK